MLAALSAIGIDVTEIQSMAAIARVPAPRIALVPSSTPWYHWKQRVLFSGACLCAALFAAVVITPFVTQSLERAAVERRISDIVPQVQLEEALRKRVGEVETGREVRAAEQARLDDPLHALAALTELLPDDTYLTDLSSSSRKLRFSGRSPAAARLIATLSTSSTVRNPVFSSPVTRSEDNHGDLLSIRADLGP